MVNPRKAGLVLAVVLAAWLAPPPTLADAPSRPCRSASVTNGLQIAPQIAAVII